MELSRLEQLRNTSSLARAIFQADVPEEVIRGLPAQALYHVIKHNGLESSLEVLDAATADQFRLLLDFDLWDDTSFSEERLWDWLELSGEDDQLRILQRVVGSLDLKIVSKLIHEYVEIQTNEEPTDAPPGPLFFTPDKGFTWIRVLCEDQRKHFLLSKVLAFLFETSADVFYQLLATKAVATPSLLEEEAFNDRTKRLASEGLPELELAAELTKFLSVKEALELLQSRNARVEAKDIVIIEPLAKLNEDIEPLTSALNAQKDKEVIASELSLLVNACLVRFKIDYKNEEAVTFCARQVQGALNVGLELLAAKSGASPEEVLRSTGLQVSLRVGLTQLLEVGKLARRYERELSALLVESEEATKLLVQAVSSPFPYLPAGFEHPGIETLETSPDAISSLQMVERLKQQLKNTIN